MQSLKFENKVPHMVLCRNSVEMTVKLKLYATAKTKMEQMQHQNMSWIEVQFLRKAIDVLCQCRRTLMYTYVFAYYLKRNNQTIIFEVLECIPIALLLMFHLAHRTTSRTWKWPPSSSASSSSATWKRRSWPRWSRRFRTSTGAPRLNLMLNILLLIFALRYCENRRKVLLDHCHEGDEKDWWLENLIISCSIQTNQYFQVDLHGMKRQRVKHALFAFSCKRRNIVVPLSNIAHSLHWQTIIIPSHPLLCVFVFCSLLVRKFIATYSIVSARTTPSRIRSFYTSLPTYPCLMIITHPILLWVCNLVLSTNLQSVFAFLGFVSIFNLILLFFGANVWIKCFSTPLHPSTSARAKHNFIKCIVLYFHSEKIIEMKKYCLLVSWIPCLKFKI